MDVASDAAMATLPRRLGQTTLGMAAPPPFMAEAVKMAVLENMQRYRALWSPIFQGRITKFVLAYDEISELGALSLCRIAVSEPIPR